MVETQPLWHWDVCRQCGGEVEVHSSETWNGLCPECDDHPE
jgi:hypothetical protein